MSSFFQRIAKAFKFGRQRYLVGKDLENNLYFEYPSLDGSTDPRKTRRLIRYRVHKELGEHDQANLSIQWLMWLRHTRRSAPTIEELLQDKERIEITQHNARVLEQKDIDRKLQLEMQAAEEARKAHQLEPTMSEPPAEPSRAPSPRATAVPTASVSDEAIEKDGNLKRRQVDMEVWEASRRRVDEQNAKQGDAFSRRAQRRSDLNEKDAERERARRAMSRSPLEDFDVTYEGGENAAPPPREKLKPRFGRAVGAGEEWEPQSWTPTPRR